MKKNLISVIILALVFANFVLTALLLFTVLPETKKANAMIDDVCAAIDLELNSGAATGTSDVPIANVVAYSVNGGEAATINLRSEDGKQHYAIVAATLSLNNKSDNYETMGPDKLLEYDSLITDTIISIISKHTYEEMSADIESVKEDILAALQDTYGKDYIVGINFNKQNLQ